MGPIKRCTVNSDQKKRQDSGAMAQTGPEENSFDFPHWHLKLRWELSELHVEFEIFSAKRSPALARGEQWYVLKKLLNG